MILFRFHGISGWRANRDVDNGWSCKFSKSHYADSAVSMVYVGAVVSFCATISVRFLASLF